MWAAFIAGTGRWEADNFTLAEMKQICCMPVSCSSTLAHSFHHTCAGTPNCQCNKSSQLTLPPSLLSSLTCWAQPQFYHEVSPPSIPFQPGFQCNFCECTHSDASATAPQNRKSITKQAVVNVWPQRPFVLQYADGSVTVEHHRLSASAVVRQLQNRFPLIQVWYPHRREYLLTGLRRKKTLS